MSEHYFSKTPQSKSSPNSWDFKLRGKDYRFKSDYGVFSKNTVDFGTQLLIESFDNPEIDGDLLDLGCGYGPIGISLANEFTSRHIVMVDVNERALELARENAVLNQASRVEIKESDGFQNIADRSFAVIISNPPIRVGKQVMYELFEGARRSLIDGGEFWIVIQKKQGAPSAKEKLESLFGEVSTVAKKKGYFIFKAVNV